MHGIGATDRFLASRNGAAETPAPSNAVHEYDGLPYAISELAETLVCRPWLCRDGDSIQHGRSNETVYRAAAERKRNSARGQSAIAGYQRSPANAERHAPDDFDLYLSTRVENLLALRSPSVYRCTKPAISRSLYFNDPSVTRRIADKRNEDEGDQLECIE